eukprot:10431-Pelagococcus_subviridis.AAC.2
MRGEDTASAVRARVASERHAHEVELVLLERVHVRALEHARDAIVREVLLVEQVHGGGEGVFAADAFEERRRRRRRRRRRVVVVVV